MFEELFKWIMKERKSYKSPLAALLWSIAIPGFGQYYNKNYILGSVLIAWEVFINLNAHINEAIYYTFRWNLQAAHDVANLTWGLYYPSVFCFSIWQAYNKSMKMNYERRLNTSSENRPYRPQYTSFLFGMVVGMDVGLSWELFISPVLSGLSIGLLFGLLGHFIEKRILITKDVEDE